MIVFSHVHQIHASLLVKTRSMRTESLLVALALEASDIENLHERA